MALQKNLTIDVHGKSLVFENCYFRVSSVSGNKYNLIVKVDAIYSQKEIISSQDYVFEPSMNGSNFIKQAYDHLKTLPEFVGATDC